MTAPSLLGPGIKVLTSSFPQPSINHRASSNFRVFARSQNRPLFRQHIAWRMNSHAPSLSFDAYLDHVANASMLHAISLDAPLIVAVGYPASRITSTSTSG